MLACKKSCLKYEYEDKQKDKDLSVSTSPEKTSFTENTMCICPWSLTSMSKEH